MAQSAQQMINDRGGYRAVAEALSRPGQKVPVTTVHTWVRLNKIPWWRMDAVQALPVVKQRRVRAA